MTTAARILPDRVGEIVGAEFLIADPEQLAAYEVDGVQPRAAARPGTAEQVVELVRLAAAEKLATIPCGARTKLRIGMPPRKYDLALDLTRLNRVLAYDPGDLTLGVEAGIPLSQLQSVLAEHDQFLPLAVPFFEHATIGGTIATNVDTPLRQLYGTARDYVLGMEFISGEGVKTKSGARVVKNVTGYDLHKLMIGSIGTLGVITRVNFKTFPRPHVSRGFLAYFADASGALNLRGKIAASPLAVSTLEILSPQAAAIVARNSSAAAGSLPPPGKWFSTSNWILSAAFSGNERVLGRYTADLTRMAEESRVENSLVLGDAEHHSLWGRLREALPLMLESSPAATVVRLSTLPTRLGEMIAKLQHIAEQYELRAAMLARGVGVVYCALLPQSSGDEAIRRLAQACSKILESTQRLDGRAMIPFCPAALKREVNIWGATRDDFALMQKMKTVFDPHGILSPGRFVGGL